MFVKQLSIFVENRPGRLSAITRLLGDHQIDIRAMSIADTRDFGILRLIVNHPAKALEILKEASYSVTLTNVIAAGVKDTPGGLADAMRVLYDNNISVEYMYAFISHAEDTAFVILRVEHNDKAAEALEEAGVRLLTEQEIFEM